MSRSYAPLSIQCMYTQCLMFRLLCTIEYTASIVYTYARSLYEAVTTSRVVIGWHWRRATADRGVMFRLTLEEGDSR